MTSARGREIRVGCAGWSLPKLQAAAFPAEGSHLERYAARLGAVEINSSFYRHHRPATYARWADSVPADFRFAVKVPREITHVRRLARTTDVLERFLGEVGALGEKLGPLLVQLPPSLPFHPGLVSSFFAAVRQRCPYALVCEPRHPSWFTPAVDEFLAGFRVGRVAADPAVVPPAAAPAGWTGVTYYRLHGSPRMYYSAYSAAALEQVRTALERAAVVGPAWCIFDNTAEGAATVNALALLQKLQGDATAAI